MDRALFEEVLTVLGAGPSLPSRNARDPAKAEAAEVRNRTAWQRVVLAIDGLQALLELRDELRERRRELTIEMEGSGGLLGAPVELVESLRLRGVQLGEVLVAFLSQAKVLLDLLSTAVATALGNPGDSRRSMVT